MKFIAKVSFAFLFFISYLESNELLKKANNFLLKGDYIKAYNLYKTINSPVSKNNIAFILYIAKPPLGNQNKAVKILKKLLKSNSLTKREKAITMYNLGYMYYNGYVNDKMQIVIKRDEALKLFLKSYKLGYKPAKKFLKIKEVDVNVSEK